jgi:hypothetical protein
MNARRPAFLSIVYSAALLITACQTAEPTYQLSYAPVTSSADDSAIRNALATCEAQARTAGERFVSRTMTRATTQAIDASTDAGFDDINRQLRAGQMEVARNQASLGYSEAVERARSACMQEQGYREIRVCESNCPD